MLKPIILIVEDNVTLLEGLKDLLEIAGYEVATAENGREALEMLNDITPDLIISDIMMPRIDGYEFQAQVRKRQELLGVPFIFLTARGGKADIRLGKELGADDYITKPFDEEDLLVAVRSKLSRWEDFRRIRDEQMAELKQKILLSMSHEFRTPLSYVLNYAEMLELDGDQVSEEDFKLFMKGIHKGAERLNRLVEDFILLVELETGETERAYLNRRARIGDTATWLRVVSQSYQAQADKKGIQLVLDIPSELPPLIADDEYLAKAIGRVIENAIKFSRPESEWVCVRAEVEDKTLMVIVQDQGIGIAENEIPSLFNIFHQIDRAKQEQQGTGSGLAISQGIVALHAGRITVESKLGIGSTFTIELPVHDLEE